MLFQPRWLLDLTKSKKMLWRPVSAMKKIHSVKRKNTAPRILRYARPALELRTAPEFQDECCPLIAFAKGNACPVGLEHGTADFKAEASAA